MVGLPFEGGGSKQVGVLDGRNHRSLGGYCSVGNERLCAGKSLNQESPS